MAGQAYANYRVRKIEGPVLLFGKLFSINQLCIALNIATVPILYLFGAGQLMFWVIGKYKVMMNIEYITKSMEIREIANKYEFSSEFRCINIGGSFTRFIL